MKIKLALIVVFGLLLSCSDVTREVHVVRECSPQAQAWAGTFYADYTEQVSRTNAGEETVVGAIQTGRMELPFDLNKYDCALSVWAFPVAVTEDAELIFDSEVEQNLFGDEHQPSYIRIGQGGSRDGKIALRVEFQVYSLEHNLIQTQVATYEFTNVARHVFAAE